MLEIQESTRPVVAALMGVSGDQLSLIPERASVKPAGSGELRAHLDCKRTGTVQVVIALTATSLLVWPFSHTLQIQPPDFEKGFYSLTPADLSRMEGAGSRRLETAAEAGDVLIMAGGRMVHGSIAVRSGASRYMAYAHFEPAVGLE